MTHAIHPGGVRILRQLGVSEVLLATGAPIERATIALGESRIELDRASAVLGAPNAQRPPDAPGRGTGRRGGSGWCRGPYPDPGLAGARRVGPLRVMPRWHGYFRQSAGPGWVLLGDAGHFKDPITGQGISDALRQADTLAPAIAANLAEPHSLDHAVRDWWAWRDRDAWQMYWFAHDLGAPLGAPPSELMIRNPPAGASPHTQTPH